MTPEPSHIAQLEAFFEGRLVPEEKAELATRFTVRQVKRRGFLLHQGEMCRHFTFSCSNIPTWQSRLPNTQIIPRSLLSWALPRA